MAGLPSALPPWQIVRERRATFAATPQENAKRPGAATDWRNLVLAGDWTQTGLPATIEGAIRSGNRAADLARLKRMTACLLNRLSPAARQTPRSTAASRPRQTRCSTQQEPDGHWVFELEADATIPAEYVLLRHYFGEPVDTELEPKIGAYLRRIQGRRIGGWPLFHDGAFDMSASVKAYFALKMIGDDIEAPHMRRARDAILAHPAAPPAATCSPARCSRSSAFSPGAACR